MLGFLKALKKEMPVTAAVSDDVITAVADGELFLLTEVADPVFSEKLLGDGVAFRCTGEEVTLCAPANGVLSVLFPTGHAYGVTMKDGTELLVHIGIDTVEAGKGLFQLCGKKQGEQVKAGDPIVRANFKKLSENYDMSTMLIVTKAEREIPFISPGKVTKGQRIG